MKFLALYVFVVALFAVTWAAKTCTIDGKAINVGQSHQPAGQCSSYKCTAEGVFSISTCPPFGNESAKCKLVEKDTRKPYPECCAHVACK